MADKVILAGGSGFLGQTLAARLRQAGVEVVVLTRKPRRDSPFREVAWDAHSAGPWVSELEGAAAVVNFTGRSINCVYTPEHRREILESRLDAVKALGAGFAATPRPPALWLQISATGYYGNAGDALCPETHPAGSDFLAEVCVRWEAAFREAAPLHTRRVVMRLGPVFDAHQGALLPLAKLTRAFLGGRAGSGRQFISWIHRDDLVDGLRHALTNPACEGTYNLCAPAPVTNEQLMRELRHALRRPWAPPAPEFAVRFAAKHLMHVDPDVALHGQRASPALLEKNGFQFRFPALDGALRDLLEH